MKMMVMKMMLTVELCLLLLVLHTPLCLSDVVDKFDNNNCLQFFVGSKTPEIKDVLEGGVVKDKNRYKLICQRSIGVDRFATLYDTLNKIPVFSAYTFEGKSTTSCTDIRNSINWRIEVNLELQATKKNYEDGIVADLTVDRGHIFPCQHAIDKETQKSTFTLTNVVPQKKSFNGGSWAEMETSVRNLMTANCKDNNKVKAYVITGAVPSKPEKTMNGVNIPEFMWTAYCCKDNNGKWVSDAHWAENKVEQTKPKITIPTITLSELYQKDPSTFGKLFPDGTCEVPK